jgi:DNA segregation ATPase FtsK/SpoIIIE-like protein
MNKPTFIDRPPRIQPELPIGERQIPRPPSRPQLGAQRLVEIGLPMVTIVGYILVSVFAGGSNGALLLIPMAISVVAAVAFSLYSIRDEKLKQEQAELAYANRLVELNKEMQANHDLQRRFYHYNYPDVHGTAQVVRSAMQEARAAERTLRTESRLWERRTDDDDFGVVRLGIGTLPSTVVYRLGDIEEYDNPQARAALKLEGDARYVSDIPVIISLRPPPSLEDQEDQQAKKAMRELISTPVVHALGVAGERSAVYAFARALTAHYAVFHTPADARLYLLAGQRREWAWTDSLPHCRGDDQNRFRCFVSEIKEQPGEKAFDDDDGGELEQFLEGIRKLLAQRKIRMQERDGEEGGGGGGPQLPFALLVVDLLDTTYDDTSPLNKVATDAALAFILEEGPALGAAVVFLVPERSKIPGGCGAVVEIERTTPATNSRSGENQKLHFRFAAVGVNSPHYVGLADAVAEPAECAQIARDMAAVNLRQGSGANLTPAVPFLDLMGHTNLDDLSAHAWRNWQASTESRYGNWLRVKIGMMSGNKPRTLVFSAKRDGVHGMVAGSTGSGKSELLISLIAGMAVTYDPSVLNFVLVDYKGGGAFKEFASLPHCVDIITNLASDGVTRMFTAINAEMKRRQALNAETGTKNIVEYRQKGLHQSHQPYPFLFIIIDEFAEMIADRAEYKAELESIARVGRAQGVSMLLAAQRPSGVTDQMRSNIKYRICLRVETPGESREMLRRADAAFLPPGIPGRGYLQVGNEEIELIQVAYSGDRYIDPKQRSQQAPVIWPARRGGAAAATQDQQPPELYKAIIDALEQLALANKRPRQRAPWPGFLPRHLALSETLISADQTARAVTSAEYMAEIDRITLGRDAEPTLTLNPAINRWLDGEVPWADELDWESYAVRPVVGLVDNPYAARQLPLVVDLPRGHVVLFGASGAGKTTFIRTMIVSLAATHSPSQLHAYVLDLGGRNLGVLAKLPHVGAVVIPDEEGYEERVAQILREIEEMIERRKLLLSEAGLPDIYQYNQSHASAPLPAVVLAIDNFVEFVETFGGDAEGDNAETVLEKFIAIARQSKPYGVHVVVTATQQGVMSTALGSLFSERLTLRLVDPTEYRSIVGVNVAELGDIPGRGYVRIGREGLAFQVAIPVDTWRGEEAPGNEVREIERLAGLISEHVAESGRRYTMPPRVDALPKAVLFKQMLAREHGLELDQNFVPRLKQATKRRWAESLDPARADWLKVAIGVVSGNRPRTLALEAKKDGVHGLVAGGTGAGKSELLMTLIVGLALNYDPNILNFVLVDYKGGGAFKPFEKLPHVVDTITNLNKAAVIRMFTAIDAEMRRRQALNADTGTKDIVEYRQKGLHKTHQPYPHLFIIIDEYAEMISANPEFGQALDSITRVGRSSGVNLLLAAQRPVGVSDQMRANIKLRMCLRVEGHDTSREMLRRPDAAFLPNGMPGRGYLQVGNEQIELIQVAYTGETYDYAEPNEGGEKPKFYDVVVQLTNELLVGPRPATPWPPFLPSALTFATPLRTRYLDSAYEPMITLNRSSRLSLNPFLQDWLDGKGTWEGVDWDASAMRAIVGLLDDPFNARQLPLVVDLARGHAVLFGASGWGKTTMLRSLVLSLVATHSPDEFQVHVFDLGGRNLEALRALPHVGTIVLPDERGYEERVQQLLRELGELVDRRKLLFSTERVSTLKDYNEKHPQQPEPAVLVVVDNFGEFMETFGGSQGDDEDSLFATFIALIRQGRAYGLHVVITANRLNVLSSKLYSLFTERFTLRLADADDYGGIVGANMPEIEEIAGRGYTRQERAALSFQVALVPGALDPQDRPRFEVEQIYAVGDRMNAMIAAGTRRYTQPLRIDALPKSSSFRQVLADERGLSQAPGRFLAELQASTAQLWERNSSAKHAEWLKVTLGVTSGNRLRTLALEAKKDGVHGMVAGGTGAGKSELLMTLIVGLALNYPPDILNFVLVDYKGGGAFKPFEGLPHVVDIVTNLNVAAVERMFTAINAEIRRRQALNADTGTKDIVEYRAKGLHKSHQPYPHLFIIIDEYAEMIDQNDAYLRELESITRVGRSSGVNLLLASQQPKGVTDQMRANIKLRLCLRVEQLDTSRELLRRPDAALLPNGMPGRGYLQIGNENLELIQVSYTGETQLDDRPATVVWPERSPRATAADEEPPKLYDMVVRLTSDLVEGRRAPKPWPAFLPERFTLETTLVDEQRGGSFTLHDTVTDWLNGDTERLWPGVNWEGGALSSVVGLVDDPAEARQDPLRLDISRTHLGLFGDAGSGKTTLLRTLLLGLAATHAPSELHLYIVDMGGRNFRSLEGLPHTGAVIYGDDETFEERLQRLLALLARMVDERQQLFSAADSSTLAEYNTRYPERALPAIVVTLDNVAELQENYPALLEDVLIPLARRSLSAGLTLVLASNVHTHMPSRLYSLLGERVTLKQTNADNYLDIIGRGAVELGDLPGRGYVRRDRRALMFHAALPVGVLGTDGRPLRPEGEDVRRIAEHMRAVSETRGDATPAVIRTLPELVELAGLLREAPEPQPRRVEAVLGMGENLLPVLFDLRRAGPHFMVIGPPLSGKTTALYTWLLSLAQRYEPEQIGFVLVDLQRTFAEYGGDHTLAELPHTLASVSEVEQLEALLPQLEAECVLMAASEQPRAIFLVIDNFDDFSEEITNKRDIEERLAAIVRRYGREGLHVVASAAPEGNSSDLRRRIQSANLGVGLRSAAALDALRVMRTPPALRNRELEAGRGFVVRSGQTTMIQVASPYIEIPGVDEDERRARSLDAHVEWLQERYPLQRAEWQAAVPESQPAAGDGAPATATAIVSPQAERVRAVMWARARREIELLKGGNGHALTNGAGDDGEPADGEQESAANGFSELFVERIARLESDALGREDVRLELLRELYLRHQAEQGLDVESARTVMEWLDEESLLISLEGQEDEQEE